MTWSVPYGSGVKLKQGASVTLPAGMAVASTNYIFVQTSYKYLPPIVYDITSPILLADQIYIQPRQSAAIPYTG